MKKISQVSTSTLTKQLTKDSIKLLTLTNFRKNEEIFKNHINIGPN